MVSKGKIVVKTYFKSANDDQGVDVKLGNVLADFLQPFTGQNSLKGRG